MERDHLLEVVKRRPILEALADEQVRPGDLADRVGCSRSTVHRVTRQLNDVGLVDRTGSVLGLTAVGDVVTAELEGFEERVTVARRLEPVLEAFADLDYEFPIDAFTDATVTETTPEDPYRTVNRFMTLVEATETLRGVDPASINPLHLDELHEAVLDGMETDAVFRPEVVAELVRNNPDRARTAFETGNLTLRTHDDLPFGLTLCDDRIGVAIYDDESGLLDTYVDTDAQAALDWGEAVFESFLADADVVEWRARLTGD